MPGLDRREELRAWHSVLAEYFDEVVEVTAESQQAVRAKRPGFYYVAGLIPPCMSPSSRWKVGYSVRIVLDSSAELSDDEFNEYLTYLTRRVELRRAELEGMIVPDDKLIEELVEEIMLYEGYAPVQHWTSLIQDQH